MNECASKGREHVNFTGEPLPLNEVMISFLAAKVKPFAVAEQFQFPQPRFSIPPVT
jgi:hypothetical protein